jgi:hypothetical protein
MGIYNDRNEKKRKIEIKGEKQACTKYGEYAEKKMNKCSLVKKSRK